MISFSNNNNNSLCHSNDSSNSNEIINSSSGTTTITTLQQPQPISIPILILQQHHQQPSSQPSQLILNAASTQFKNNICYGGGVGIINTPSTTPVPPSTTPVPPSITPVPTIITPTPSSTPIPIPIPIPNSINNNSNSNNNNSYCNTINSSSSKSVNNNSGNYCDLRTISPIYYQPSPCSTPQPQYYFNTQPSLSSSSSTINNTSQNSLMVPSSSSFSSSSSPSSSSSSFVDYQLQQQAQLQQLQQLQHQQAQQQYYQYQNNQQAQQASQLQQYYQHHPNFYTQSIDPSFNNSYNNNNINNNNNIPIKLSPSSSPLPPPLPQSQSSSSSSSSSSNTISQSPTLPSYEVPQTTTTTTSSLITTIEDDDEVIYNSNNRHRYQHQEESDSDSDNEDDVESEQEDDDDQEEDDEINSTKITLTDKKYLEIIKKKQNSIKEKLKILHKSKLFSQKQQTNGNNNNNISIRDKVFSFIHEFTGLPIVNKELNIHGSKDFTYLKFKSLDISLDNYITQERLDLNNQIIQFNINQLKSSYNLEIDKIIKLKSESIEIMKSIQSLSIQIRSSLLADLDLKTQRNHIHGYFSLLISHQKCISFDLIYKLRPQSMDHQHYQDSIEGSAGNNSGATNGSSISGGKKNRRTLNEQYKNFVSNYFKNHSDHPYPNEEEKIIISALIDLSKYQRNNWFSNKRSREKNQRILSMKKQRQQQDESF